MVSAHWLSCLEVIISKLGLMIWGSLMYYFLVAVTKHLRLRHLVERFTLSYGSEGGRVHDGGTEMAGGKQTWRLE